MSNAGSSVDANKYQQYDLPFHGGLSVGEYSSVVMVVKVTFQTLNPTTYTLGHREHDQV